LKVVKVPSLLWYGDTELVLEFPDEWIVETYPMDGSDRRVLSEDEIKLVLSKSLNSKTISKLAENSQECAIVVDDMTRPTRAHRIVPHILTELKKGGISSEHIRFIIALGAHGACDRVDFVKKLGNDIVDEYYVYNHNPFHNLTYLGETSRGTPVNINSEFMDCDLRIGIGCIVPHPHTGFGGGSKIILPGIAGIDTISHNHGKVGGFTGPKAVPHPTVGWGKYTGNVERLDMEETAKMAGLQIKLDAILNSKAQTTALFVGDPVAEFAEGVKLASKVYSTQIPTDVDVVVANTYFKANEANLAIWFSLQAVKDGGTMVLIANAPDGQVTHYAYGKFGIMKGGTLYSGQRHLPKVNKFIIYSPYKIRDPFLPILDPIEQVWMRNWDEVIEEIKTLHGNKPRIAVFPNAEVQIPPDKIH
jgi:nickel-dependent lactate racemase